MTDQQQSATVRVEDSDDDTPRGDGEEATIRDGTARIATLESIPRHVYNQLPPEEDGLETQGGAPVQSDLGTISLPQAGGSVPERAGDTTISIQGKQTYPMQRSPQPPRQRPIEMVVYFQDKHGLHLTCEDGQHMEAGELFEIVMDEMKYPAEFREIFSLWLVSDLLELQLKPNHVPFKLVCFWEELLEKYTTVDEDDRERDEPVIMFQRNVFYPKWKEQAVTQPEAIRLLCYEAKEMVIDGRYPLKPEQYDYLAGLMAQVKHKQYDPDMHTPEYYRNHLTEYYPEHLARTKWKIPGIRRAKDSPEFRVANCHRQAHERFKSADSSDALLKLYQTYMNFVWGLPYYGAAFFRGQIEHPGGSIRLWTLDDDPVWIAVNTDGVFVLDMDDVEFLVGLPYEKLSWEYGEPRDKENPDCLPCLFISWPATEDGKDVTKMLQVFSKEAVLADSMIEACIGLKQKEKSTRPTAAYRNELDAIVQSTGETWQRFNKMCLATFSRKDTD